MVAERKERFIIVKQTLSYLAVILAAVQILTGTVWILCNFMAGCKSEASARYLAAAESGLMDEYIGVLYPFVMKVAQIIAIPFGGAYEQIMYIIQVSAAVASCVTFWRLSSVLPEGGKNTGWCYWVPGLMLVTIPLCVQWHLTILPNSLAASLFMLLLGHVIHIWRTTCYNDKRWVLRTGILWALLVLLMPDYLWLSLPPMIFYICGALKYATVQAKKHGAIGSWYRIIWVLVPVALALSATGLNHAIQQPGSGNRIQKSVEAAMVSRFVWPHFGTNYFFWPDEIKEIMTEEQGARISDYADQVQTVFGPLVEGNYGQDKANDLYIQMARSCLEYRTKEVLTAIGEDFVAYVSPVWMVKEQLDGAGLTYTGYHYDKMRENTPLLTKWYVHYGLSGFRAAFLLAVVCGCGKLYDTCRKRHFKGVTVVGMLMVVVLLQAFWYTMSGAGMMEYGNVCVIQMLWYCAVWRMLRTS